VDNKLNMSEQGTTAATKANGLHLHVCRGITNRDRDVIIPLYSALDRLHVEYRVQNSRKLWTDWRWSKGGPQR